MMLSYAKAPYTNVSYDLVSTDDGFDGSSWFGVKPELKAKNPLVNLPYIILDGKVISQSNACLIQLGKKLSLISPDEEAMCEQTVCEVFDLRNKMTGFCYSGIADEAEIKVAGSKLLVEVSGSNSSLAKLQLVLEANKAGDGAFLVGSNATPADFHLFEMVEQYVALSKWLGQDEWIDALPGIKAFHLKFKALPGNATYLASDLYTKLPFNQKMAVFGSHPDVNQKYAHGLNPPAWHGTTVDVTF